MTDTSLTQAVLGSWGAIDAYDRKDAAACLDHPSRERSLESLSIRAMSGGTDTLKNACRYKR
jgi:hypothetical protein